jgi:hypothetical protein
MASGAVTAGGTIYAIKRFREAESVIKRNTLVMYDHQTNPPLISEGQFDRRVHGWLTEGDSVTVDYELSEPESRKWWIAHYERKEKEAIAEARDLRAKKSQQVSDTRMVMTTETDAEGNTKTGWTTETYWRDRTYSEKQALEDQALDEEKNARKYAQEAKEIKGGKKVQLVRLDESFDTSKDGGGPDKVKEFLTKEANRGSKLVKASKLPVQYVKWVKNIRWHGGAGIGAALLGIGGAGAGLYYDSKKREEERTQRYYQPTQYKRAFE